MRKINKLKILKTLQNKTKRIVFSITNWDKSYFIFTWLLFLFFCFSIQAKDWSDLDEGEKKDVYGSEKRKKYSASNLFFEIENWEKHYGVRILYLYDHTDYPKYNSTYFIPFYNRLESKIDNRKKFRFLNYTFKEERKEIDRSIFPIAFWGNNTESNKNYNSILPFYYSSKTFNKTKQETNLILFPLTYYYLQQSESQDNFSSENNFSILHGRISETYKTTNLTKEKSIWFPIIPIVRHTQLEDSYYHYIFPIYGFYRKENSSEDTTKFGFSIFPFYYSNYSYPITKGERHYEITNWTLFHYRSIEEDRGGFREYTHKSKWGFPLLPFGYYSSYEQGEGNYKRLLTLFHWENSENGELNAISFLPFFFYKKQNYFRIPILLVDKDLSSPAATSGRTFMPIFLYYNRWDTANQTFVLGPWVSLRSDIQDESFSTFFPFYWKRKSEKRDFTLILPIYANYNDKENDYHFNLFWFTKSNSGLINPNLSVGTKEDKWYFDTDLTLLYYLASISFRQTLDKPKFLRNVLNRNKSYEEIEEDKKKQLELEQKNKIAEADNKPKLSRKKSVSREESLSFSGYSLLFGLLSYEAADTRRHFRLLPLSWFSWDKTSDDKVYVAPLFLWYQTEVLEYFVFFPFYGKQKDEDAEKKAFLINLFISESYKAQNWKENSVVWPFVNWYSSDSISGHRFLPFYIHKTNINQDSTTNTNYSLLSYYNKRESKDYSQTKFYFWPLLVFYKSNSYKELDSSNGKKKLIKESSLWFTPFLFRSNTRYYSHTNLLWFIDWESNTEQETLNYLIIAPFYYFSHRDFGVFPISFNNTSDGFQTFTLLNYFKKRENYFYLNSFVFLAEIEKQPNSFEVNFLFRSFNFSNTETQTRFSGLFGYGWDFSRENGKWKEASILSYLGGGYRLDGGAPIYNLSLLFYHEVGIDYYKNWTLGNYRRVSKEGIRNNFLYLADYEYFAANDSTTWDFLFTGIQYHNFQKENYFRAGYGFLWNFRKENDLWSDATFLWLGYSKDREAVTYNFLPVIRTYDSKDEQSRIYGPMLLYTSKEVDKDLELGLLGLAYWHKKEKQEETYILLGALYREYTKSERGFRSRGSLWGWLWNYEKEEETAYEKYSLFKIFSYTKGEQL